MIVEDGGITTTGASTAVLSYVLQLIARRVDPALAQHTARMMLIDPDRHSQAPYISLALTERPRHSLSEKAEHFLQKELHRELSIAELAQYCGYSDASSFRKLFKRATSLTPADYRERFRLRNAGTQ